MEYVIKVRVIPNAKRNEIKETADGYRIYLTAPPREDKANKALVEILADFLKLKKSQLSIIKGAHSKEKIIQIMR